MKKFLQNHTVKIQVNAPNGTEGLNINALYKVLKKEDLHIDTRRYVIGLFRNSKLELNIIFDCKNYDEFFKYDLDFRKNIVKHYDNIYWSHPIILSLEKSNEDEGILLYPWEKVSGSTYKLYAIDQTSLKVLEKLNAKYWTKTQKLMKIFEDNKVRYWWNTPDLKVRVRDGLFGFREENNLFFVKNFDSKEDPIVFKNETIHKILASSLPIFNRDISWNEIKDITG